MKTLSEDNIPVTTRPLNLTLLGAVYGLLWGGVALAILMIIGIKGEQFKMMTGMYLLGSIPTGILMTRVLARRLGAAKAWTVWPYGLLALLLGTWAFAFCMLLVNGGVNFVQNLRYQGAIEAFRSIRTHDSVIMFYWYPLFGFSYIAPIFLAVWNCWDLRHRMHRPASA